MIDKSFGKYIQFFRNQQGLSLQKASEALDITPAYLSDIENGNRAAPTKKLKKMIEALRISDINLFYDLAGRTRNNSFPDINEYLGESSIARMAIRAVRDTEGGEEIWRDLLQALMKTEDNDNGIVKLEMPDGTVAYTGNVMYTGLKRPKRGLEN